MSEERFRKISALVSGTPAYASTFSRVLTSERWVALIERQIERAEADDPKVHVPAMKWIAACVERLSYQQAIDEVHREAERVREMAASVSGGERRAPWSLLGRA